MTAATKTAKPIGQSRWRKFERSWDAFKKADLVRVGTLVEIGRPRENRREVVKDRRVYLIGDVNENAGLCSCCGAFEKDAVVYRYVEALSDDHMKRLCADLEE